MEGMLTSLPHLLLAIGLILLIAELALGFSTILLLTLGLSFLVTSALMFYGEIEETLLSAILSIAVAEVVLTFLLWRPMKRLQADKAPAAVKSDWIGTTFELTTSVAPGQPGEQRFAGVSWKVKSTENLSSGTQVQIVNVEVGVLHVEAV